MHAVDAPVTFCPVQRFSDGACSECGRALDHREYNSREGAAPGSQITSRKNRGERESVMVDLRRLGVAEVYVMTDGPVGAPADRVYELISDHRNHRPRFLPANFSNFEIEHGGVGAGTIMTFTLTAGSRSRRQNEARERLLLWLWKRWSCVQGDRVCDPCSVLRVARGNFIRRSAIEKRASARDPPGGRLLANRDGIRVPLRDMGHAARLVMSLSVSVLGLAGLTGTTAAQEERRTAVSGRAGEGVASRVRRGRADTRCGSVSCWASRPG